MVECYEQFGKDISSALYFVILKIVLVCCKN